MVENEKIEEDEEDEKEEDFRYERFFEDDENAFEVIKRGEDEDKSEEEKYNLKHLSGEHNQLTHGHGSGGGTRLGGSPGD